MSLTAYNPNDPAQTSFLQALALGETGGSAYAPTEGVGGVNLSGAPTDAYGFPQWAGQGGSHAAGIFQFQPATWDALASQYGLNFQNPEDQATGAWILAQQTDPNISSDLTAGNFSSIQSALASIWPSVTGNAAAPAGLANNLASGLGAGTSLGSSPSNASTSAPSSTSGGSGWIAAIENFFVRFGLIIVGALLVLIALWVLLSKQGVLPSPSDVGEGVAKAVAL